MTNHEIIKRLIGPIEPVGETNADNDRFDNLKEMVELGNQIIAQIADVVRYNKSRCEYSRRRAGEYAHKFLMAHFIEEEDY